MTSFAVVARVRRVTHVRRVGHGGTLDPDASGVLPIGLGQGTRVFEYFAEATKVYQAEVVLGVATDTYDAAGTVVARHDPAPITRQQVVAALVEFRGHILQRPPMFSALKRAGQRLYDLARRGQQVELEPRPVHILRLELLDWRPPVFTLEVECGRGTYIRSLAHDVGQKLGCGAHLQALVRTRDGPFTLDEAVTLEDLERAVQEGTWCDLRYPLDSGLLAWRAAILGPEQVRRLRVGQALALDRATADPALQFPDGEPCRAYSTAGDFLAVLRYRAADGLWRPEKVFATEHEHN
ncbi:MAG: tRNA pseudouridine(55) synthase TruB [Chloroflexi bacterium]|nr:tRNA pseudouridine(55) synthase TruB [Chloroflexota bacterium]